ncbi:uncharacterized protein [Ptychodera flava]|uniref:uncharacterized protein isoform X6 n=1 Tax=Ptychodera flava TaxID=63121 RepID=UPI003969E90C
MKAFLCATILVLLLASQANAVTTASPSDGRDNSTVPSCEPITIASCVDVLPYTSALFPNSFARSQEVAKATIEGVSRNFNCSEYGLLFACGMFAPGCSASGEEILPCRSLCQQIQANCSSPAENFTAFDCNSFPVDSIPELCPGINTACLSSQYECKQNECIPLENVCDGSEDCSNGEDETFCDEGSVFTDQCVNITLPECSAILPYHLTAFPNILTANETHAVLFIEGVKPFQNCSEYVMLFACAAAMPECSYSDDEILPCRSLCEHVVSECQAHSDDRVLFQCDNFPEQGNQNVYCPASCASDEFTCIADNSCIPIGWLCDGTEDCADASDESHTNCTQTSCTADEFTCERNHACIPIGWFCDGIVDCFDTSDENHVECDQTLCTADQFYCESDETYCIPAGWFCDGIVDCSDGSDENHINCTQNLVEDDGQCVNITIPECINSLPYDMAAFPYNLATNQTQAARIISDLKPFQNCSEYLMLFYCATVMPECTNSNDTKLPCRSLCEQVSLVCGTHFENFTSLWLQCDDYPEFGNPSLYCPASCTKDEFTCVSDNSCIPVDLLCNGIEDCTDASDEHHANCSQTSCTADEFTCESDGTCIPVGWFCDDTNDCVDGSDENHTDCNQTSCTDDEFSCESGETYCIPSEWLCDGTIDCFDGSDENHTNCTQNVSDVVQCEDITIPECSALLTYDTAAFPNNVAANQTQATQIISDVKSIQNCSDYLMLLYCAAVVPECSTSNDTNLPCRALCEQVNQECGTYFESHGTLWLQCDAYPESGNPDIYCPASCKSEEFTCVSDNSCIPVEQLCDGTNDCLDGSDENPINCNQTECTDKGFLCANETYCIPVEWLCDGIDDCSDGSDENHTICDQNVSNGDQCVNITIPECSSSLPYDFAAIPNHVAANQTHAARIISDLKSFQNCSEYLMLFSCAVVMPECSISNDTNLPCRSLCEQIREECGIHIGNDTLLFQCDDYPEYGDSDIYCPVAASCLYHEFTCVHDNSCIPFEWFCDGIDDCLDGSDENHTDCIQNFEDQADQCVNITISECSAALPYDFAAFPNNVAVNQTHAARIISDLKSFQNCSEYLMLFSCAVVMPECSISNDTYLPCRSLCEQISEKCGIHFGNDTSWLRCNDYPESGNPNIYCPVLTCTSDEFTCVNDNSCIPVGWFCDGIVDCLGGSDENHTDCNRTSCTAYEYTCDSGLTCIPIGWFCDDIVDCFDGSDERITNCNETLCKADEFSCANDETKCIPVQWLCDGEPDCADASDENHVICTQNLEGSVEQCVNITSSECSASLPYDLAVFPNSVVINQTHAAQLISDLKPFKDCSEYLMLFSCATVMPECTNSNITRLPCRALCEQVSLECGTFFENITSLWLQCDDYPESGNPDIYCPVLTCTSDEFTCVGDNSCIPVGWFCDGIVDCLDGSDENHTACVQNLEDQADQCVNITMSECSASLPYDFAAFPNNVVMNQTHAARIIGDLKSFQNCSEYLMLFSCAVVMPDCSISNDTYLPCRSLCEQISEKCGIHFGNDTSWLRCNDYPESGNPNIYCPVLTCTSDEFTCVNDNSCIPVGWFCDGIVDCLGGSDENHTDCNRTLCKADEFSCANDETKCIPVQWLCDGEPDCADASDENHVNCTQNLEGSVEQCVNITASECSASLPYGLAVFPNSVVINQTHAAQLISDLKPFKDCSEYLMLFSCATVMPECTNSNITRLPCRALCEQVSLECGTFFENITSLWLQCDDYPESGNPDIYCPVLTCTSDEFTCVGDNSCIHVGWFCDGINDCLDGSDENHTACVQNLEDQADQCVNITMSECSASLPYDFAAFPNNVAMNQTHAARIISDLKSFQNCSEYLMLFSCAVVMPDCSISNDTYLPCRSLCEQISEKCGIHFGNDTSWLRCNDYPESGNPNIYCPVLTCTSDEFTCVNDNSCIPVGWFCDGIVDCLGGSDENHTDCNRTSCTAYEYTCDSGLTCIPIGWFCDDIVDCFDGSDERITNCNETLCTADEFSCANDETKCIPVQWLCDGEPDCANASDENHVNCTQNPEDIYQCENVTISICDPFLPYNLVVMPNDIVQSQKEAYFTVNDLMSFQNCSEHLMLFACSAVMPECSSSGDEMLPCRSLCEQVLQECGGSLANDTAWFHCDDFPESGNPNVYCPGVSSYDQCHNVTIADCSASLPYNVTVFPNNIAANQSHAFNIISGVKAFENCSEYLMQFTCAAVMPECSSSNHARLPCRSLCEQVVGECGDYFGNETEWMQCDDFPIFGHPEIYCPGESHSYQCENITIPECNATLPYNLAAVPNRLAVNQTHASVAISKLTPFHNCSEYLMLFVCAAILPECTASSYAMLPCRSLCELVVEDCSTHFGNHTEWLQCEDYPVFGNPDIYCPGEYHSYQCENITIPECNATLPYNLAAIPNRLAVNQTHASVAISKLTPFRNCSEYLMLFACAAILPECTASNYAMFPCRSLCELVVEDCSTHFGNDTEWLQCDDYPVVGNPDIYCPVSCEYDEFICESDDKCIPGDWFCDGIVDCADAGDENHTDCNQRINSTCLLNEFECSEYECITNTFHCDGIPDCSDKEDERDCTVAYGSRSRSLQCEKIAVSECENILPYNSSVFPNSFADNQQFAAGFLQNLTSSLNCSEHALAFACSVMLPECSETGHIYLPCRSLCEKVRTRCRDELGERWTSWGIDCDYFPEFGQEACFGDVVQSTTIVPTTLTASTAAPTTLAASTAAPTTLAASTAAPTTLAASTEAQTSNMPTEAPIIGELEVSIICLSNCYLDAVTVSSPLVAQLQCSNCPSSDEWDIEWTLRQANQKYGVYRAVEVDDTFSSTGTKSDYLSINADQLESGSFYRLQVTVSIAAIGFGVGNLSISTNSPPANGECAITPSTGYALDTKFVVNCSGWEDVNTPLLYAVYSQSKGSTVTSQSYAGYDQASPGFLLPLGYESHSYLVDITVNIVDVYGAQASYELTVTVEPPSITGDDLTEKLSNLTSGEDSALGELIDSGDTSGAATLVITVASVLNTQAASETESDDVEARRELRESVIDDLKSISDTVDTVDEVSEMANALVAMTSIPEELTDDSQVNSALAIEQLSTALVGMKNESEDDILATALAITQSAGNVLSVSTDSGDDDTSTTITRSQSSTITKSVVNTVEAISEAVLSKRVPGQPPVVFNTSTLSVQLQRDKPSDVAGSALESSSGNFQLPSAAALFGDQSNSSYVDTQFLAFSGNPFDWDNSSAYISSDVISLSFSSADGNDIIVTELTDDILIELPKSPTLPEPEPVNITNVDDSSGLLVYGIEVPLGMAVHFRIIPDDGNTTWEQLNYTLYFTRGQAPSLSAFNYTGTLPNLEHENDTDIDDGTKEELRGTFFVPSTIIEAADSYYIGVLDDLSNWNFNVQVFTSGCKYWDESVEQWKSDGCKVSNKSSSIKTYCECDHLTSFASDFFVPPNTIDFDTVFAKFANLKDNLSVFLTVFLILALYVPIMVWARWMDKKDIEKWGVTPLLDNQRGDKYLYQITVYTGMRTGAGTKSNVFVMIVGENGKTRVRHLKDRKRQIFQRGSKCTFLMAVPECLGDLYSIHIWHDNSGKGRNASWYLSRVIVADVQTRDCFHFLCERWLAVEEDDCQVQRILPVASSVDLAKFNQLFMANAKKDFTDGHIWFSVVSRPSRSHFTRVQRVSCCLSILYTSMVANCMWYNTEGTSLTSRVIELGPFSFTLHSIYVGIVCSLIVFPINLLLIQLFRKSLSKQTVISASNEEEKKKPPLEPGKVADETDSEADQKMSVDEVDKILKEIQRDIKEADKEYEKRISFGFPYRKFSFASGRATNTDVELLLKSGSVTPESFHKDKKDPVYGGIRLVEDFSTTTPSEPGGTVNGSVKEKENGAVEEKPSDAKSKDGKDTTKKKTKLSFMLPYWCIYIAWCLVFLTSALSAFFTILYSMEWGNDKSIDWLVSFLTSFAQSVFVIQPIKVLVIAILLAFIFRSPDPETEVYNVKLQNDEEYLHTEKDTDENIIKYEPPPLDPPDPVKLEEARLRRQKEVRMWQLTKEIIAYFFFLLIVCILAFSNRSIDTFYQHKALDTLFFQNDEYESIESEGFAGLGVWLTDVLIPGLYPTELYNGDSLPYSDKDFIEDLASYRIGSPRLRHLRVRSGLCQVVRQFANVTPVCYEEYSKGDEDKALHGEFWSVHNDSYTNTDESWLYQSSDDLDGLPIYGVTRMYYGGGYVAELGRSRGRAQNRVQYLWNSLWFDRLSRAVFVEFPLYNANANLFSMVTLLVEFPTTGGALLFQTISVLRLYHYAGAFWVFYLTCELIFIVFVVYFIVREILRMKRQKCDYFKKYWSWVEMIKLVLCLAAIFLTIQQSAFSTFAVDELNSQGPNTFVNLQQAAAINLVYVYILASIVFLSFIKLINILRFNRRMALLSRTFRKGSKDFIYYGIVFFIIVFAYSQALYLVIGAKTSGYRKFITSVESLFSAWLGQFDYDAVTDAGSMLAVILFFTFTVSMFAVLTTFFVTIIIIAFLKVKMENDKEENKYEMVKFLSTNIREILGLGGSGDDDAEGEEEEEEVQIDNIPTRVSSKTTVHCEDEVEQSVVPLPEKPEPKPMKKAANKYKVKKTMSDDQLPTVKDILPEASDYYGMEDLKERINVIANYMDAVLLEDSIRKGKTIRTKFIIDPDSILEEPPNIPKLPPLKPKYAFGEETRPKPLNRVPSFMREDEPFFSETKVGRCHLCGARTTSKKIERHIMLRCPTVRPDRADMMRNMVEVFGEIQPPLVRDKARLWWKFYKENSKVIRLAYIHDKANCLKIKRASMKWFDLPKKVQKDISIVLLAYFDQALRKGWSTLPRRTTHFLNLHDFVVE